MQVWSTSVLILQANLIHLKRPHLYLAITESTRARLDDRVMLVCTSLKRLTIHCIVRLEMIIRSLRNMLVHYVMLIIEDNMLRCLLRLQTATLHARSGWLYINWLLLMELMHVLSLFVFPELQSILDSLNVFRVCILRNLYGGNRRTIDQVV